MFRDFVFKSNFLSSYKIGQDVIERIKEDELELLKFSLKWLRFTMFGEGDFQFVEEAEKRAKEKRLAAVKAKIKAKEEREKELISKKPEEIMKEADKEE